MTARDNPLHSTGVTRNSSFPRLVSMDLSLLPKASNARWSDQDGLAKTPPRPREMLYRWTSIPPLGCPLDPIRVVLVDRVCPAGKLGQRTLSK